MVLSKAAFVPCGLAFASTDGSGSVRTRPSSVAQFCGRDFGTATSRRWRKVPKTLLHMKSPFCTSARVLYASIFAYGTRVFGHLYFAGRPVMGQVFSAAERLDHCFKYLQHSTPETDLFQTQLKTNGFSGTELAVDSLRTASMELPPNRFQTG